VSEGLPVLDAEHPWPGLFPYGEDAHAYFNGRERETVDLLRLVRRDALTLLYGQSGLGKSSLLRAGLFPKLREEALLPIYIRLEFRNRALGLREQVWNIVRAALSAAKVDGRLPRDDESLWAYFHAADLELWDQGNRMVIPVLVFDQFEEIVQAGEERDLAPRLDAFMEELADLVENRIPPDITRQLELDPDKVAAIDFNALRFRCVIGFREDFLPDLEQRFATHNLSTKSRLRITKMGEAQAMAAVEKTGGKLVDGEVARRIVQFVSAATGRAAQRFVEIEPALLSVVCFELNSRRMARHEARISADLLAGAQEQIIAEFYQRGVADLDPKVQIFIERELLTESGYRDSCALDDAVQRHGVPREALQALVDRRVLRQEERFGVLRVELTHDVLAPVVRERRDRRQALEASERDRQRESARVRRNRMLLAVGGALMSVATILVVVFFNLFRQAEREKSRVIEAQSTLFLSRANASLENNVPAEPVRYLAQAIALNPRNEGAIARLASLATQRSFARKVWEKEFGQSGDSTGAVVALDGDEFAFLSNNSSWRFAQVIPGKPHPTLRESCVDARPGKDKMASLASFTFDATTAATPAGVSRIADADVELAADKARTDALAQFRSRCVAGPAKNATNDIAASRMHAIESRAGALWQMAGTDLVRELADGASRETIADTAALGDILRVFPSASGDAVIVAGEKAAALYVRKPAGTPGQRPFSRAANIAQADERGAPFVNALAATFDGAGKLALVSFENGLCQLWDTATARKRWSRACGRDVQAFVPGKPWVALSTRAATGAQIEIVSITDGQPLGTLTQPLAINHIAFASSGELAVIASQDRTAKVYTLPKLAQVGSTLLHEGAVVEAHFRTAAATQVITASFDGSARLWDWQRGRMLLEPMLHPGPVLFARPVMDGAYLLTLGDDRRLRLWRADPVAGEATQALIRAPAVSAAGDRVAYLDESAAPPATAGTEGPRNRVMVAQLAAQPASATPVQNAKAVFDAPGAVQTMSFSMDAKLLAIAGADAWLAIVKLNSGVEPQVVRLSAPVERVTFATDGELVVTQLGDNSLRVIDIATGRQSGLTIASAQPIIDFGVSRDSKWLSVATGAQLQVFDLRTGYPVARVAPGGIVTAAVHPSHAEIAFATRSGLTIWRPELDPRGVKKSASSNSQPSWLQTTGVGKAAREISPQEGKFLPLKKLLVGMRFTPDGSALAAYSIDGMATTWNSATLEQGPELRHSSSIVSMGMSGDGRWLTTTALDGLARVWDHRTGQLMSDLIDLRDSERELMILGPGTWALVQSQAIKAGTASQLAPAYASFEWRMLGLGFKELPPIWFVPTVATLASGGEQASTDRRAISKDDTTASAWWESWLRYVATKHGVNIK
jgi:WD40 repeat protein